MNNKKFEKKQMNAMKLDILADQMIATLFILKADLKIDVRPINQDVQDALGNAAAYLGAAENMMSHSEMYKNNKNNEKESSGEENIDKCSCRDEEYDNIKSSLGISEE